MTDKTEIEQVREALTAADGECANDMSNHYEKSVQLWMTIIKALQEKLKRLENGQQKKRTANYIMTGEHCPKCGDKMILNYKSHECGECNYIHCSAEVFSMLPPAPKQGDK